MLLHWSFCIEWFISKLKRNSKSNSKCFCRKKKEKGKTLLPHFRPTGLLPWPSRHLQPSSTAAAAARPFPLCGPAPFPLSFPWVAHFFLPRFAPWAEPSCWPSIARAPASALSRWRPNPTRQRYLHPPHADAGFSFLNHRRPNPPPNLLLPFLEQPRGHLSRAPSPSAPLCSLAATVLASKRLLTQRSPSRPPSRAPRRSRPVPASLFYVGEFASSFSFDWYRPCVKWWPKSSPLKTLASFCHFRPWHRRRVPVSGRQLTPLSLDTISAVHFKSDGYKSRIPLRPLFLLKSPSRFLDLNPRSKM
jgi:hypothetical protein